MKLVGVSRVTVPPKVQPLWLAPRAPDNYCSSTWLVENMIW